jgi:hypothetical protein
VNNAEAAAPVVNADIEDHVTVHLPGFGPIIISEPWKSKLTRAIELSKSTMGW